ncbi:MAG: cytochrome c, partial [Pseudomonadales bacterium]|nr:cytochrome c [Pseudomonadales bacterium]
MPRHSLLTAAILLGLSALSQAQDSTRDGVFTSQQAAAGATLYTRSCIECHGATLRGGEAGPALIGAGFWNKWAGQSTAVLYQITASTMPVNNPGGFTPQQYASLVAFMLQQNGLPAGDKPLSSVTAELASIKLEESFEPVRVVAVTNGASAAQRVVNAEWTSYHGEASSMHYAPL